MDIVNTLLSIPAWMAPAAIAIVLGLAALVIYLIGLSQGYTSEDYKRYRQSRRRNRRRR